jgi:Ca2+-binding RTX toxin-like protein
MVGRKEDIMGTTSGFRISLGFALLGAWLLAAPAGAATCNGLTCTIEGTSGNDTLGGTSGNDVICSFAGADTISAAGGADTICGGFGDDSIFGEGGNDVIIGEPGVDTFDGGTGNDEVRFLAAVTATLGSPGSANDGSGTDTLWNLEFLVGSDSADTLTGDGNNNTLTGRGGNDTLKGLGGADVINGSNGNDTAVYDSAINANLSTGSASDGDTLSTVENLTGSTGADTLTGDGNANILDGGSGGDTLAGNDGNDTLNGGPAGDTLDGGNGTDTCNGGTPPPPIDVEADFCTACETVTSCDQ